MPSVKLPEQENGSLSPFPGARHGAEKLDRAESC
jgi:hypothetical protein